MNKPKIDYSLYLVTDRKILAERNLIQSIEAAILGGVSLVQLREKSISTNDFYNLALTVKQITDQYNVPLIINDRLDIALAINATGVHLGQNDLPPLIARKLLNPNQVLGVSATNLTEALKAEQAGADYLGIGAIFPTETKKDADYLTLDELAKIKQRVKIPIVAIGGINRANIQLVKARGVDGIAVVSAILAEKNIRQAAEDLKKLIC